MPLTAGLLVGPYEILAPLGAGGMGEVYRALDRRLGREVAIKVLAESSSGSDSIERLRREARAVAAVNHPNILAVYDLGELEGSPFLVFELLDGETLRGRLDRGPIPVVEAVEIAVEIARGLAAAHERGIVHRDLKPENLFLTRDGRMKILDFGLARIDSRTSGLGVSIDEESTLASGATKVGMILGTLGYLSPEQAQGLPADARTDLFACGAVLFEMVTGERAFIHSPPIAALAAVMTADPVARVPDLPQALQRVLARCLEKEPARRWSSARELAGALSGLTLVPSSAARSGHAESGDRPAIAVLPFVNLSADPEQEYFCQGMAEDILHALARVDGIRVASRTASFRVELRRDDPQSIGEALGVTSILEGSVRRVGQRLRINIQLVNAADGLQMWVERFDREAADVFDLQDEIAQTVVQALKVRLSAGAASRLVKRTTADFDAYELYLKGRFHWHRRSTVSLGEARRYFEQAIERDPRFAEAYCGLHACTCAAAFYAKVSGREAKVASLRYSRLAMELAPDLADSWTCQANHQALFLGDWRESERSLRKAIEIDEGIAIAHSWMGNYLCGVGRSEEGLREALRGVELDPALAILRHYLGYCRYLSGDAEGALSDYRVAVELDPGLWIPQLFMGVVYDELGRHDEAIAAYHRASLLDDSTMVLCARARSLALAGDRAGSLSVVDELERMASTRFVPDYDFAAVHLALGSPDRAIFHLERAVEDFSPWRQALAVDPRFSELRGDKRYAEIIEKLGLDKARS
ncbi:MAG: protein kinase [Thermoanaerobaculia bacterium]